MSVAKKTKRIASAFLSFPNNIKSLQAKQPHIFYTVSLAKTGLALIYLLIFFFSFLCNNRVDLNSCHN